LQQGDQTSPIKFRLLLMDGIDHISGAVASNLNEDIELKKIKEFSIIKVIKFILKELNGYK